MPKNSQSARAHQELFELVQIMPEDVKAHSVVRKLKMGTTLLRGGNKCDNVHILTSGMMQAIDESIYGVVYAFSNYQAYDIFGEMEIIGGFDSYQLTIRAIADSSVITMPQDVFLGWMQNDNRALNVISRMLTIKLWEASQSGRSRMFAPAVVQMMMFFSRECENSPGLYLCPKTRQQIADETGLSVKTINRGIKTLQEMGYLTLTHGHVTIDGMQNKRMLKYLSDWVG